MKKTLALFAALVMLLSLFAGCSGTSEEAANIKTGTYIVTACTQDGEDAGLDGEYLEVNADGTGLIFFGDAEYSFDWTLDGSNFSFEDQDGDRFEGTYENGVIEGSYYGYDYVFEQESSKGSGKKGGEETAEEEIPTVEPGEYQAIYCADDENEYWCDEDKIIIEEGGLGIIVFEGVEYDMEWTLDGEEFYFIDEDEDEFTGTYADGVIEGVYGNTYDYIFELGAEPILRPDVEPGVYQAVQCTQGDESYYCDDDRIIIEEGGVGTMVYEGVDYAMEWSYEGGEFYFIDVDGDEFNGTYSDGVIEGNYGGVYDYVFELDGSARPAAALPEGDFEPVSASIGDYDVTIVGAEHFLDIDDEEAIRIYYDFTNNSNETVYAMENLEMLADQEGYELLTTYDSADDDVPEYGNNWLVVRPGVTIRCIEEYSYQADGGAVSVTIQDWWEEEGSVTAVFDPASLPGRPAQDWEIQPITDVSTTLPNAGAYEEDYEVAITGYDLTTDWDGQNAIRVYFDFTNNSTEATSFWMATYYRALQDGVEMEITWPMDEIDEDENYDVDIEPGETITCTEIYALRSDSPVEVELYSYMYDGAAVLADVFPVD